jgi:hypothetical protein
MKAVLILCIAALCSAIPLQAQKPVATAHARAAVASISSAVRPVKEDHPKEKGHKGPPVAVHDTNTLFILAGQLAGIAMLFPQLRKARRART